MKKTIRLVLSFFLIAVFAGCTGWPVMLGPADQGVQTAAVDFTKGRPITAEASGFQLFIIFPIDINQRHHRAYQRLKAKADYDYITDIKIKESWTYWLVGTAYTTTIEATAYPLKDSQIQ